MTPVQMMTKVYKLRKSKTGMIHPLQYKCLKKTRLLFSLLGFVFMLAAACSSGRKRHKRALVNPVTKTETIVFGKKLKLEDINFFGFHPTATVYKGKPVFCFLAKTPSLYLLNPENMEFVDSIRLPQYRPGATMCLRNDSLFIYDFRFVYTCVLGDTGCRVVKKEKSPRIGFKQYYYDPSAGIKAGVGSPTDIIFNYGNRTEKENSYLDKNSNFMRFTDSTGTEKMGYYPADFFSEKRYYTSTLFDVDNNGDLVFTFEEHDSVYKMSSTGRMIAGATVESDWDRLKFKWKKETNLAYVRQYTCEAELNRVLHITKTGRTIILKKSSEKDIRLPEQYRYFVFDPKLKLLYADSLQHTVNPNLVFDYKNGVAFFSMNLDEMYYYEID
jgi:hypothetical protein